MRNRFPLLAGLVWAASAGSALADTPRIAVISAFQPEWQILTSKLTDASETQINGTRFVTGTLQGKNQNFTVQASEAALARAELSPALVMTDHQETQAVIKVFQEDADETSAEVERLLSKQLKVDAGDASEAPRMWLAGISGLGLRRGVARIVAATGVFCRKAAELLQSIREALRARDKAAREKAAREKAA